MSERFAVYRYPADPEGLDQSPRYSFAPLEDAGAGGRGTPPSPGVTAAPLGHVEAPAGSRIAEVEPPVLEVPDHGRVDISAVIGATEGNAEAGRLLRWQPA